jgi:hypothetical protein
VNKTKRDAAFKKLIKEMKDRGFQNISLEILRTKSKNITVVAVAASSLVLVGIAFHTTVSVFLIFKSTIASSFSDFSVLILR